MYIADVLALITAQISVLGGDFKPKGKFTPYVKISRINISNKSLPSEAFSFFYKRFKDTAVVESNLQNLEIEALILTAKAINKLDTSFPLKTRTGLANTLMISKTEYLVVAVIASDPDCVFCANYLASEIANLK